MAPDGCQKQREIMLLDFYCSERSADIREPYYECMLKEQLHKNRGYLAY